MIEGRAMGMPEKVGRHPDFWGGNSLLFSVFATLALVALFAALQIAALVAGREGR